MFFHFFPFLDLIINLNDSPSFLYVLASRHRKNCSQMFSKIGMTPTQVISCKCCKIYENTAFSIEHIRWLLYKYSKPAKNLRFCHQFVFEKELHRKCLTEQDPSTLEAAVKEVFFTKGALKIYSNFTGEPQWVFYCKFASYFQNTLS